MKEHVTFTRFVDGFHEAGRGNHFSHEGLELLFQHLEEIEESTGEEIEFDPVGLCCEFGEYADLAAFQRDYGGDFPTLEAIAERTTVLSRNGSPEEPFLVQKF